MRPICAWCNKPIFPGETSARNDIGEELHLIPCLAEDEENVFFDRDMEFGDQ